MVDALITALAGGGTGLLGSLVGRVAGFFEEKQKIKRLSIELEHELKLQELQSKERQSEREHEYDLADMSTSTQALIGSYEHDATLSKTSLRWVRPVLTAMLIIGSVMVYSTLPDGLTKDEIAQMVVYYAGLAISWWFADRSGNRSK